MSRSAADVLSGNIIIGLVFSLAALTGDDAFQKTACVRLYGGGSVPRKATMPVENRRALSKNALKTALGLILGSIAQEELTQGFGFEG